MAGERFMGPTISQFQGRIESVKETENDSDGIDAGKVHLSVARGCLSVL